MKLDNGLELKIRKIDSLRKKTQRRINKKKYSIWINIHREIKEQNKERKIDLKERENDKFL